MLASLQKWRTFLWGSFSFLDHELHAKTFIGHGTIVANLSSLRLGCKLRIRDKLSSIKVFKRKESNRNFANHKNSNFYLYSVEIGYLFFHLYIYITIVCVSPHHVYQCIILCVSGLKLQLNRITHSVALLCVNLADLPQYYANFREMG